MGNKVCFLFFKTNKNVPDKVNTVLFLGAFRIFFKTFFDTRLDFFRTRLDRPKLFIEQRLDRPGDFHEALNSR